MIPIKFKKLNADAKMPSLGTSGAAAFDFYTIEDTLIDCGDTKVIKTGLAVEIPDGYYLAIYPRSSTGFRTPLRLSNSVGIIDSDYRGEIGLIFTNTSLVDPYSIARGERLAQGIIAQKVICEYLEVDELSETKRDTGGIGSTGK